MSINRRLAALEKLLGNVIERCPECGGPGGTRAGETILVQGSGFGRAWGYLADA